jgi:hypothetical protein
MQLTRTIDSHMNNAIKSNKAIGMKYGLKVFACLVACMSVVALARPVLAKNRAYSALSAVFDDPNSAPCFAHSAGEAFMKNICATARNVFLPMSVDGADWYTLSVYGRGWINANGTRNTIACNANYRTYNGAGGANSWQALPNNGAFGGAQALNLGAVPVFSAGDSVYAYCVLAPYTQVFSYGWN